MRTLLLLLCALALAAPAFGAKTLDIYFVDVEGGQATLIVSPDRQSILVDTGWPGFEGRDASRIHAAAKDAGVKRIDYLVTTHYHTDHVGGIQQLLEKLRVVTFVDHGPNVETSKSANELTAMYEKAVQTGKRLTVKPGDKLPLKGIDVGIVTANGERVSRALSGGGAANPACTGAGEYKDDPTENARSVGFVLSYGKFRFINLGDLTAKKELELACPENRIGPVDVYLTTHHGLETSNAQPIVHGLRPRVAIMNNGAKKGGSPVAWRIIRDSPELEDIWQLHFALAGGKDTNTSEPMIANLEPNCAGRYIRLSASRDGSFTVTNARNNYSKTYAAR
ncbi:MAG TPA: MBL fold metallo-hydrolase [Bryobacteraceae bacterium]|nr:MBL fold metallo-hydrolase [Bryobacteraceae bacterium]